MADDTRTPLDVAMQVTRFWSLVKVGEPDDCWPWIGYEEDDYGRFFWDGRMVGAHELALTFTSGEVRLPALHTCHACNNPPCCNPRHLRFDTALSNVEDSMRAGTAGNPKLTVEDVVVIRERLAAGAPLITLARRYGVGPSSISQIGSGKRWRHAPGPLTTRPPGRPNKTGARHGSR